MFLFKKGDLKTEIESYVLVFGRHLLPWKAKIYLKNFKIFKCYNLKSVQTKLVNLTQATAIPNANWAINSW